MVNNLYSHYNNCQTIESIDHTNEMIKKIIQQSNLFAFDKFWKADGNMSYSSVCGGLVSLPFLVIIIILLVLKLVQMINYGIVMSNTQINYSYQPPMTTFSSNVNDAKYAPFMVAFGINVDSTSCPNKAISFQAIINQYNGAVGSANRKNYKVPINIQACTDNHFSMLQGKMKKVNQWTSGSLYCIPNNFQFQIGGSNSLSQLYKNIQFKFTCPTGCSSTICGNVDFYSMSSSVNLGNASSPFSYYLTRNKFTVQTSPKYQVSYQIDSSNITSDNSILPFSLNSVKAGFSLGNVITDIPSTASDTNTYVILEKSDKYTMYLRSYYKIFDLVAYLGAIVYGLLILLFFVRNFSQIQFQLNFAAQYFRVADSKSISFRGYLKQLCYQILKNTRFKPDWEMAAQRQESREAANRVLDVVYLNKRIAFLQQAISLMFQKHQLKAIYLLHRLSKEEVDSKINAHRFRDRVVYFLGKKYKYSSVSSPQISVKFESNQKLKSQSSLNTERIQSSEQIKKKQLQEKQFKGFGNIINPKTVSLVDQTNSEKLINQLQKPKKLTLKTLVQQKLEIDNRNQTSLIIHQADQYYLELARSDSKKVKVQEDSRELKHQLSFIGEMSSEEFNQVQLVDELKTDVKRLIEEAQQEQGNAITKKICQRLDKWLLNYLTDTLKQKQE